MAVIFFKLNGFLNLLNIKHIMVKIIYLSWNLDLKILYMSWNFYRKFFNVLFQNPMRREHVEIYILKCIKKLIIRPRGVFDKVAALEPGGPGSIPGGVRNFNFCPGIGRVSFVCVLSYVVSGGSPDIVPTTHSGRPTLVYLSSVLVQRLLLPLHASDQRAFVL